MKDGAARGALQSGMLEGAPRTVFHLDMDAFFVSVEELFDPSLKGKAVVVGGQRNERGVVSAASYEARKFGVHSAMPLRTAARLCPHAIFVDGHPERYREYSQRVYAVLGRFSPKVEMASIDEAYLDMTGTERLHGPPLSAAHALHAAIQRETRLNCSIGIATSRLVAKVSSDQAKPNGVLWVLPGEEARFLAPLDVRKIPGVGKVLEKSLHDLGIRKVGDLAALDESFLDERFGKWGLALAGKARGLDAGGWFDSEIGANEQPKSISHEHTFNQDTADVEQLESTLARLSEMVCRRLREHGLYARTVQLKLRYKDFSTITRARSLRRATQVDGEILEQVRALFRANWKPGAPVRLLGVHASSFEAAEGQLGLLDSRKHERWRQALSAADRLRDKYGEDAVSLATGLKGGFHERTHENPASLPGKRPRDRRS
ncbi:MAG TPA: DNA polymerase IV [Terriglobales bacterium]|nr:DNA polymerase IV [Terriglobales bacterium]